MLKAGVAAGTFFLPLPFARLWAQSEGALRLLLVPKIALLVGNSRYREFPLRNPANDARAIGEGLHATGFEVTVKLDAVREEMALAVQAYVAELAKRKCVGLFYYAGHGIQLAWRNYMLPVDSQIASVEDVEKQGVDVGRLLEGLTTAGNPMNMVILDACRDNPFGSVKGASQKGLAQMDAPPSTLLAFATSPGNVASDGEGVNGLYTERLVNELKVPEARVEDVFKRVRLAVRRKSAGQQVPWESTSLEEDFYFRPPASLKKASDEEKERRFREELAAWEKAKPANTLRPLEEYLRRYPSGQFSELAQLQLDRLLAREGEKPVQIASAQGNPYTKGTAATSTSAKVGDSYTLRRFDRFPTARESTITRIVVSVTDSEVVFDSGLVHDLLGNLRRASNGDVFTDNQYIPTEFTVGKQWVTRFDIESKRYGKLREESSFRVASREPITVPAGTFNAFRIEARGFGSGPMGNYQITRTFWRDPERVRFNIAQDNLARSSSGMTTFEAFRLELVAFKQA